MDEIVDMVDEYDVIMEFMHAHDEANIPTSDEEIDIHSSDEQIDEPVITGSSASTANRSVLTFNASVSNKKVIKDLESEPFQIMASTRNYLTNQTISTYPQTHNPNLLLHMNYITRVFNNNAIETNSRERFSLQQYAKLAERVGTKDILIHMPCNVIEVNNVAQGLSIIHDELLTRGIVVHLEIAAWTQELITARKIRSRKDVVNYISEFVDLIIRHMEKYKAGSFMIVFDTAHLYAIGAEAKDQMQLFNKYRKYMKYCHLNGNVNGKLTSDSHAPIMSDKSKLSDWEELSTFIAKLGLICVAEVTKYGKTWEDWKDYAEEFGFNIIKYHEQLSI